MIGASALCCARGSLGALVPVAGPHPRRRPLPRGGCDAVGIVERPGDHLRGPWGGPYPLRGLRPKDGGGLQADRHGSAGPTSPTRRTKAEGGGEIAYKGDREPRSGATGG